MATPPVVATLLITITWSAAHGGESRIAGPTVTDPAATQIEHGRRLFTHVWQPTTASPESGDGLGPLFNARSCAECHHQGGVGGAGANEHNVQFVEQLFDDRQDAAAGSLVRDGISVDGHSVDGRPIGGLPADALSADGFASKSVNPNEPKPATFVGMLHRFGIRDEYALWRITQYASASRRHATDYRALASRRFYDEYALKLVTWDGVTPAAPLPTNEIVVAEEPRLRLARLPSPSLGQRPRCYTISCGRSCISPQFTRWFWEVNTPPLFGLGRLEQVTIADVQAIVAAQPEPIRGRAMILPDGRLGRFGWKAQHASLRDFSDEACAVELGLTTPTSQAPTSPRLHPTSDDEFVLSHLQSRRANPDVSARDVDALAAFIAALPQPREEIEGGVSEAANVRFGRQRFHAFGCAGCHVPNLGAARAVYSDLLLHDIGTESGGDYRGRPMMDFPPVYANIAAVGPTLYATYPALQNLPKSGEFRTPPLWGVADSAPYLHDGSAATLEEAILRHRGQASASSGTYRVFMEPEERDALIAFLKSLRAP